MVIRQFNHKNICFVMSSYHSVHPYSLTDLRAAAPSENWTYSERKNYISILKQENFWFFFFNGPLSDWCLYRAMLCFLQYYSHWCNFSWTCLMHFVWHVASRLVHTCLFILVKLLGRLDPNKVSSIEQRSLTWRCFVVRELIFRLFSWKMHCDVITHASSSVR